LFKQTGGTYLLVDAIESKAKIFGANDKGTVIVTSRFTPIVEERSLSNQAAFAITRLGLVGPRLVSHK
jgi:hypothetical protein